MAEPHQPDGLDQPVAALPGQPASAPEDEVDGEALGGQPDAGAIEQDQAEHDLDQGGPPSHGGRTGSRMPWEPLTLQDAESLGRGLGTLLMALAPGHEYETDAYDNDERVGILQDLLDELVLAVAHPPVDLSAADPVDLDELAGRRVAFVGADFMTPSAEEGYRGALQRFRRDFALSTAIRQSSIWDGLGTGCWMAIPNWPCRGW